MHSTSSTPTPVSPTVCSPQVQPSITWDAMPVPGVSVSDLSQEALDAFRARAVASERMREEDVSVPNEVLLRKLNLIDGNTLKQAAVLLFHPEPSRFADGAFIRVGKYKLEDDGTIFLDVLQFSDDVSGPLILQLDKCIDLIRSRYSEELLSWTKPPVPVQMLSDDILRELLMNAIVHKDYTSGIPIRVSVHEDRVNVTNTGTWPDALPMDEKIYGLHASYPRNPFLVRVFARAGMMENWGSGYQKLRDICNETHTRKPRIKAIDGTVSVTASCCNKYWSLLDISIVGINNDPRLDFLNPDADFKEICRRMSVPVRTLVPMVQKMLPDRDFSKILKNADYIDC